jgi:hypothetical protein
VVNGCLKPAYTRNKDSKKGGDKYRENVKFDP